jgi:outer membrane protein assembly factor BamB
MAVGWTYELAAEGAMPVRHDNLVQREPVTDGERVYAVLEPDRFLPSTSPDGRSGRVISKGVRSWEINWGNGSSPILHNGMLIVVCYHQSASYLIALDVRTGRQLWKTDRPRGVLSQHAGRRAYAHRRRACGEFSVGVEGHDVASGRSLWHFDEPNQFPIPVAMP